MANLSIAIATTIAAVGTVESSASTPTTDVLPRYVALVFETDTIEVSETEALPELALRGKATVLHAAKGTEWEDADTVYEGMVVWKNSRKGNTTPRLSGEEFCVMASAALKGGALFAQPSPKPTPDGVLWMAAARPPRVKAQAPKAVFKKASTQRLGALKKRLGEGTQRGGE